MKLSVSKAFLVECLAIAIFGLLGCRLVAFWFFNLHFLDPISEPLKDFHFSDLYYSEIKCDTDHVLIQSPIVLLNADTNSREEIAEFLKKLAYAKPAVVGIDIVFRKFNYSSQDSALMLALNNCPNLVLTFSDTSEHNQVGRRSAPEFGSFETGYDNFIGDDYRHSTIRSFYPYTNEHMAFAVKITELYEKYLKQKSGSKVPELMTSLNHFLVGGSHTAMEIDYSGNTHNFTTKHLAEYIKGYRDIDELKDRIIIIGSIGKGGTYNPGQIQPDMFFTPVNSYVSGRTYPDMSGPEIHANITQMLIDQRYITHLSAWWQWFIGFVCSLLLVGPFMFFYTKYYKWFHATAKLLEITLAVILLFSAFALLKVNIKLELEPAFLCIFLFANTIYFYDGFIKLINSKILKGRARIHSMTENHH